MRDHLKLKSFQGPFFCVQNNYLRPLYLKILDPPLDRYHLKEK